MGCPLACRWCHNPEGLSLAVQQIHRSERCLACGDCINLCPQGALALSNNGFLINHELLSIAHRLERLGLRVAIGD